MSATVPGQAAEDGLQVRHQQGGRDALAGHVAEQQHAFARPRPDEVEVVAADRAQRDVPRVHLPPVEKVVALGQQPGLDAARHLEVVLERAPLPRLEVVEADAAERIGQEPLRLHRVVADVARTERARVEPFERGVDLLQQPHHLLAAVLGAGAGRGRTRLLGDVALKTSAALMELLADDRIGRGGQERALVCVRDGAHRPPSCAAFLRSAIWPAW